MGTKKNNNAVGYIRTAIKDPTKEALKKQEDEIRKYCALEKLKVLRIFEDNGASGMNCNRPGWTALKGFIQKNGKVGFLIVPNADRIARDFVVFQSETTELRLSFGIEVRTTLGSDINSEKILKIESEDILSPLRKKGKKKYKG